MNTGYRCLYMNMNIYINEHTHAKITLIFIYLKSHLFVIYLFMMNTKYLLPNNLFSLYINSFKLNF